MALSVLALGELLLAFASTVMVPDSEEAMTIIFYLAIFPHDLIDLTMLSTHNTHYLDITLHHSQLHPLFLVQMPYFPKHFTSSNIIRVASQDFSPFIIYFHSD
jgi:hypothetical protein